jgi:hypothetical protein
VADLLTSDRILLVTECKGGPHEEGDIQVIQRRIGGRDGHGGGVELDIAKGEGLRATSGVAGEVFGGAKHPEEPHHGEVGGVTELLVLGRRDGVEGRGQVLDECVQVLDDCNVDGMGPCLGVVCIKEAFEESSQ